MATQTKCRSCGASIFWGMTESGKIMPINAEPSKGGNINILYVPDFVYIDTKDAKNKTIRYAFIKLSKKGSGEYVSHFTTCPQANKWRNRFKHPPRERKPK